MSIEREFKLLEAEVLSCSKCDLHKSRTQAVFSRGALNPRVLFIGEAPGLEEDLMGKPFVGRSGKLLDRWIAYLEIDSYAITNVVKCRPPRNRAPTKAEVEACKPYLIRQIAIYKPKLIVLLGKVAIEALLGKCRLSAVLGKCFETKYGKVTALYHPSYCLRFNVDVKKYLDAIKLMASCDKYS
ncbi:MAG: uracil-DNA glycosylase [Methanocellales archaeon]